jgi:hypothetical protein
MLRNDQLFLKFSVDLREMNNSELVDIEIVYRILKESEQVYVEKYQQGGDC